MRASHALPMTYSRLVVLAGAVCLLGLTACAAEVMQEIKIPGQPKAPAAPSAAKTAEKVVAPAAPQVSPLAPAANAPAGTPAIPLETVVQRLSAENQQLKDQVATLTARMDALAAQMAGAGGHPAGSPEGALAPWEIPARTKERLVQVKIPDQAAPLSRPGQFEDPTDARARAAALQLRKQFGPEIAGTVSSSSNRSEGIFRETLAADWHVSTRTTLAAVMERDDAHLTEFGSRNLPASQTTANLDRLDLRAMTGLDPIWQGWVAGTAYESKRDYGVGAEGDFSITPWPGRSAHIHAEVHEPWGVSTNALLYGAFRSGLNGDVQVDLMQRINLSLNAGYHWLGLEENNWGWGDAGEIGGRLGFTIFQQERDVMSQGFKDRRLLGGDAIQHRLLFTLDGLRGFTHTQSNEVSVSKERQEFSLGLVYDLPISQHWGFEAGGRVGEDKLRRIKFSKLYGYHARVIFVLSDRIRFWTGTDYSSEAPAGVPGGPTTMFEGGFNIKF